MARDRIFINNDYRTLIESMKNDDLLGFNLIENKEVFFLAVALGMNNPKKIKNKDGWFLMKNLRTSDKALIASVLLGTANDDSEVDSYSEIEKSIDLCEECAEAGFEKLHRIVVESNCNEEIIENKIIDELDDLYLKYMA